MKFVVVAASFALVAAGQNSLPNPYQPALENWAKLPAGRAWGSAANIALAPDGHFWVFERCGGNSCADRAEDPILEFDSSGRLVRSFGGGMFAFPHGIFVDRSGNVWVTDGDGKEGKGHIVVKFSREGKVLLTLGKKGVAGSGPDEFHRPSAVVVSPAGEIFVADGHGGDSNARIVKFSKDGKYLKEWGRKGSGPGEFAELHGIALDSRGRVLVADRGNRRIQVFDQDSRFLDQWTQFGAPSGIFIGAQDRIYVPDNTSGANRPEWPRGIRIGSAKDGSVAAFLPDPGAENVVADAAGNIYAAEVTAKMVKKFVPHAAQAALRPNPYHQRDGNGPAR